MPFRKHKRRSPNRNVPANPGTLPPVTRDVTNKVQFVCGNCGAVVERPADALSCEIVCTSCRSKLSLPRGIEHACDLCGFPGRFPVTSSGSTVTCAQCQCEIPIPKVRAHAHRSSRTSRSKSSGLVFLVTLLLLFASLVAYLLVGGGVMNK